MRTWPSSSNTASGCHNDKAKIGGVTLPRHHGRRASPRIPNFSRRQCASCAAASCRLRAPGSRTARLSTRWSAGSKIRSTSFPNQAHITDSEVLHRLNRKEYENAVHDLLLVDVNGADLLPPDDTAQGFDNIASALQVSPSFIEQYVHGRP